MWELLKAAQALHAILVILAAIAFFRFWVRTRFWFPRYAHYLALFGLVVGMSLLMMAPADAPISRDEWGGLKKAGLALIFPGLVYFFFVFYGGQRAAYARQALNDPAQCPHCGASLSRRADHARAENGRDLKSRCPHCGRDTA